MSVVTPKAIARYSHTSLLQLGGGAAHQCLRAVPACANGYFTIEPRCYGDIT